MGIASYHIEKKASAANKWASQKEAKAALMRATYLKSLGKLTTTDTNLRLNAKSLDRLAKSSRKTAVTYSNRASKLAQQAKAANISSMKAQHAFAIASKAVALGNTHAAKNAALAAEGSSHKNKST